MDVSEELLKVAKLMASLETRLEYREFQFEKRKVYFSWWVSVNFASAGKTGKEKAYNYVEKEVESARRAFSEYGRAKVSIQKALGQNSNGMTEWIVRLDIKTGRLDEDTVNEIESRVKRLGKYKVSYPRRYIPDDY